MKKRRIFKVINRIEKDYNMDKSEAIAFCSGWFEEEAKVVGEGVVESQSYTSSDLSLLFDCLMKIR